MAYALIGTLTELAARVVPGQTREDDYLEFKGLDSKGRPYEDNREGKRECAADVAQFANASGGTIVIGAPEQEHVVQGLKDVPTAEDIGRWIGDVINEHLEPFPRSNRISSPRRTVRESSWSTCRRHPCAG